MPPAAQGDLAGEQKRFHADVKDPTSPQAEAAIRNTFRAPRMPAGMLQTLECRRVLCRLEMIWHPLHDPYYQVVMEQLVSAGATPLATRGGEPDERGMVRVEMIWERPN